MFAIPYYHELIKKTTIGFGALFSQIKVIRRNPASGVQAQVVSVPIAFGPKEKILTRIDQDPSLTGHTYITLPRMAFEITGYNYDTTRMVNRNNKIQCYKEKTVSAIYSPVPYNIEFSLYILTKGTEDGLAIIEQILPLFTPEYSFTVNAVPELNISQDIPVVLNSISVSDDYEGDFAIRRLVTHTLNFTAKINLFGNLQTSGLITRVDADIKKFENYTATMDEDGNIVVDVWREQSRQEFESNLAAIINARATVSAPMDPTRPAVSTNALVSVDVSANMQMLNPLAASIDVTADAFVETFNALFANIDVSVVVDSAPLDVVYGAEVTTYISRVQDEGATVLPGVAAELDVLVQNLKDDGTWSSITDLHIACGVSTAAGACVKLVSSNPSHLVTATNYIASTYMPDYIASGVNAGFNDYSNQRWTIVQTPPQAPALPRTITAPQINFPSVASWGVFGEVFNYNYIASSSGSMQIYSDSGKVQKVKAYNVYANADYVDVPEAVCGGDIVVARETGKLTIQACNTTPKIQLGSQSTPPLADTLILTKNIAGWFAATGLNFAQTQSVRNRIKQCLTSSAIGRVYGINAFYYYGDSLTDGTNYGGQISWPNQLAAQSTYPAWTGKQVNFAFSNTLLSGFASTTYSNTINQTAPSQYQPKAISLVLYGTNDLRLGTSATTVFGNLQTTWARIKATGAGARVVAFTIPPRNDTDWSPAKETQRLALNTQIRAASANYDFLIDFDLIPNLVDPDNTTYYSTDKLHFTTAGHTALANYVYATVDLGTTPVPVSDSTNVNDSVSATSITGFVFQNVDFFYSVDGFAGNFPALTLVKGQTYDFNFTNVSSSRPIALRLANGNTAAVPGTTGNNTTSGVYGSTVRYQVPLDAPSSIVYQCVIHPGMIGVINIID